MIDSLSKLRQYRYVQKIICIHRDNNLCVICYSKGKMTKAVDVHHVFGRGDKPGDWREHYSNLMCVCRECHPPPAFTDKGSKQSWVVDLLDECNLNPINKMFDVSKQWGDDGQTE